MAALSRRGYSEPMKTKKKNSNAPARASQPAKAGSIRELRLSELFQESEVEEARRELRDEPDRDAKDAILESAPESERWDPVPGSRGYKAHVAPNEDEDEEGRGDTERLVEEGVADAEQDHLRQAVRSLRG